MGWTPQEVNYLKDAGLGLTKKNVTEYVFSGGGISKVTFDPDSALHTGTLSNGNMTIAAGTAQGNYGYVQQGSIGQVVEFIVEAVDSAAMVGPASGGLENNNGYWVHFRGDGSYRLSYSVTGSVAPWAIGDRIGLIIYGNAFAGSGRLAFFKNGVLVVYGNFFYYSGGHVFYAAAGMGRLTLVSEIISMAYATAYQAFRDVDYCTSVIEWQLIAAS